MPKIKVVPLNYYKVLEVEVNASDKEIRQAYKRLALKWHPDKHRGSSIEIAEQKFKEIGEAYETLCDKNKRSSYDAKRRQTKNEESKFEKRHAKNEESEFEKMKKEKEERERIVRERREKEIKERA
ncbi:16039_t:CDS:1 [Gigaspora rosea]|nr:16039_t:CDS:1 [Gigaspora rosea]